MQREPICKLILSCFVCFIALSFSSEAYAQPFERAPRGGEFYVRVLQGKKWKMSFSQAARQQYDRYNRPEILRELQGAVDRVVEFLRERGSIQENYRVTVHPEQLFSVGEVGGTRASTFWVQNAGEPEVWIRPDVVRLGLDNLEAILETILVHEDVHIQQYREGRRTSMTTAEAEVEAITKELSYMGERNYDVVEPKLDREVKARLEEEQAKVQKQRAQARKDPLVDDIKGGFEDRFPTEEEARKLAQWRTQTKIRKFQTTSKLLKSMVNKLSVPELERLGPAGEYLSLFDITENMITEEVNALFKDEYLKRFPELTKVSEARHPVLEKILQKLIADRLYELSKARGQALWGKEAGLSAAEREVVTRTRAFLEMLKRRVEEAAAREIPAEKLKGMGETRALLEGLARLGQRTVWSPRPMGEFVQGLQQMGKGEMGLLVGPLLVDTAVDWYDNDKSWQAGLTTLGLEGSKALGIVLLAHNSPLVSSLLHGYMALFWPEIVAHVAKGTVYVAGNLFQDYLIRDNMVRALYLEEGLSVSGLGFPAGTRLPGFFDSPYGKGVTRQTLYEQYTSPKEIGEAVLAYRDWLAEEPEGVTGPIWNTIRDPEVWGRIADRAKADWYESTEKPLIEAFESAEAHSAVRLTAVQQRTDEFHKDAEKPYEGAEGFIVDVQLSPEQPQVGASVNLEVVYAIAGTTEEATTVDLVLQFNGPDGQRVEKILEQERVAFDPNTPLIVAKAQRVVSVPKSGTYAVVAKIQPRGAQQDQLQVVFQTETEKKIVADAVEGRSQSDDVSQITERLNEIAARAAATAEEVVSLCQSSQEQKQTAQTQVDRLASETGAFESKVSRLRTTLTTIQQQTQQAKDYAAQAYRAAEAVTKARETAQQQALDACQLVEAATQSGAGNPTTLLTRTKAAQSQVEAQRQRANADWAKAKEAAEQATRLKEQILAAIRNAKQMESEVNGVKNLLTSSRNALSGASNTVSQGQGKLAELESLRAQAAQLLHEGRSKLAPSKDTAQGKELLTQMEGLYGRVVAAQGRAGTCPSALEPLEHKLAEVERSIAGFGAEIDSLVVAIPDEGAIAELDRAVAEAKASADTAEVFVAAVEARAEDAARCAQLAQGQAVVALTISPANSTLNVNDTQPLSAVAKFADGSTKEVTGEATWAPGASFTATTAGVFTVTATYQGIAGSAMLTVNEPEDPAYKQAKDHVAACQITKAEQLLGDITSAQHRAEIQAAILQEAHSRALYREGRQRLDERKYEEALSVLRQAMQSATLPACQALIEQRMAQAESGVTAQKQRGDDAYSQALAHIQNCDIREVEKLLGQITSPEQRAEIEAAIQQEAHARELFKQAVNLSNQRQHSAALRLLREAQGNTPREACRKKISSKIAEIQGALDEEYRRAERESAERDREIAERERELRERERRLEEEQRRLSERERYIPPPPEPYYEEPYQQDPYYGESPPPYPSPYDPGMTGGFGGFGGTMGTMGPMPPPSRDINEELRSLHEQQQQRLGADQMLDVMRGQAIRPSSLPSGSPTYEPYQPPVSGQGGSQPSSPPPYPSGGGPMNPGCTGLMGTEDCTSGWR